MTEYEMNDGWDIDVCYPLEEALANIEEFEKLAYELRNCVRTKSLQEMRDELKGFAEGVINAVDQIKDDDKIVEVDEEWKPINVYFVEKNFKDMAIMPNHWKKENVAERVILKELFQQEF